MERNTYRQGTRAKGPGTWARTYPFVVLYSRSGENWCDWGNAEGPFLFGTADDAEWAARNLLARRRYRAWAVWNLDTEEQVIAFVSPEESR